MDNERIWNIMAKKLAGEATPEELLELEKLLKTDPDLHYSFQAIHDLWVSRPAQDPGPAEKAFEKHLEKLQAAGSDYFREEAPPVETAGKKYRSALRWTGAIFAGLVLLAGLIYRISGPQHPGPVAETTKEKKPSEVVTQNGTRTKLLLPDGSTVWLNAGSRLIYDSTYGNTLREISLTGEAFFDVVKNQEKPFIIHAGNINIRVLGTAFNVKSYPGEKTTEASLIRGKIEVTFKDHAEEKVILKPNQKLVVENEAVRPLRQIKPATVSQARPTIVINPLSHFGPDNLISETAWVENKLVFQDESFLDLARKMERWYGIRISFDNESLDTLHFTGSFEKENIQQALKALQLLSDFSFTIHNGEAHIFKTN
jgi:ferric-dicitrate binding protein FerR (iron transport regulator)